MKRGKLIALHILLWLVVFVKSNIIQLDSAGLTLNFAILGKYFTISRWLISFGYLTVSMFAFYGSYIVSKRILVQKRILPALGYSIVLLAALIGYRAFVEMGIFKTILGYDNYKVNASFSWKFFVPNVVFYYWDFLMYGIGWAFFMHWQKIERMKREEESISKAMQLTFLQSQLNPHFLFNTINDIYALSLKKSDKTPGALVQLSGLLRYALYDNKESTVPLRKELTYIQDYLNLQRTGYENVFYVTLQTAGNVDQWRVPPMLLLPFVENACKHGITHDENNPVLIRVSLHDKKMSFIVINRSRPMQKDAEGGIGIGNIRKRLELLYPLKHRLLIKEDNDTFTVEMEIDK